MRAFGQEVTLAELTALVPDVTRLAGVRQFRETNGAGSGQRIIRIESGGGLSVELLPDRTCDIGQVWMDGVPFCWTGPIGAGGPAALGANSPLSGMMTTCGFDHIRQPVTDEGHDYVQHGAMMHQPATVLFAGPVRDGDALAFCVTAEATSFALGQYALRLHRSITVPFGGNTLSVEDEVTVLSGALPLMAMYHINFGFPLAGPESRLTLGAEDVTASCLGEDGVRTRSATAGTATLSGGGDGAPAVTLDWDHAALPVCQTLRNATPGVNLICLEPASHDRLSRAELRARGELEPSPTGTTKHFRLDFTFDPGHPA